MRPPRRTFWSNIPPMMSTSARSAAPHHALINSNGGDIRTKTSAPTSRLHFSHVSLEKGFCKCSDE